MKRLLYPLVFLFACNNSEGSRGDSPAALPCDEATVDKLATELDTATGFGVDRSKDGGEATIKKAIESVNGRRVALKNCVFRSHGNDEVSFGARKEGGKEITCKVAGGDAGARTFRRAAVALDSEKLRLDVSGVVGTNGNPDFTRYMLTECSIKPHE